MTIAALLSMCIQQGDNIGTCLRKGLGTDSIVFDTLEVTQVLMLKPN